MPALTAPERLAFREGERPQGRLAFKLSMARRRAVATAEALSRLPTPRFGTVIVVVLGATGLYGMSLGGHTTAVIDEIAQPFGFSIDDIDVSGNRETSEIDVLQALWSTGSTSLPSLDPEAARATLEAMPWIESAAISKIYPNRVVIKLVEHQPYALWQKGRELFIVDKAGREIVPYSFGRYSTLPLMVGTGAAAHAAELLDQMDALPELRARVKAYIRVGDRRWDMRLDNGVTIRLPEDQPVEAAAEVARMDRETGLLSRDIAAVDVRLADRMVIKLTPDSLVRRNAALKEREKLLKRSKKENPV
ncbi:cell division protein FtsQ/DivIB [Mangrovicella endophytica]|uniref:cell division protein FtsQ/DivIB n=1 Tax=Mangrovicella endophytica TaxID=2066697 RepID=UPI001FE077CC|nr:cell division protein FtsQ/DivIB [Mangrovicella endophytica]